MNKKVYTQPVSLTNFQGKFFHGLSENVDVQVFKHAPDPVFKIFFCFGLKSICIYLPLSLRDQQQLIEECRSNDALKI